MLYDIRKPLYVTIDGEHHDTLRQDYPGCFSYFANYYGLVRWSDTTTPRTDRPVRFYPKGRPAPYPGPTDVCVEQAYGTSFRVSDAIRVF